MRRSDANVECEQHEGHAAIACPECFADGCRERSARRAAVVAKARSLVGSKFAHLGRSDLAVDCVGLVILSFRAAGIPLQDFRAYRHRDDELDYVEECLALWPHCDRVMEAGEGDAFLFAIRGTNPTHFGIATADGTLIQASNKKGVVVEHRFDERWARRAVLRIRAHD